MTEEVSPHGQTTKASAYATALRLEPHGTSSRASLPDSAPSLEPKALLQITALLGIGGVSVGYSMALYVLTYIVR
jgi:hypothetical protein